MNRHIISGLLGALCCGVVARAEVPPLPDNPYGAIVARNVFGLVPIPTNPPVDPTPAVPPPKITPNGIMDIFGNLQALFKVALPGKPGLPPHDESYVLSVGESQDEIEVTKIDQKGGVITFNNHGVVQELPLVPGEASGGAVSAGGGGPMGGGPMGGGRAGGGPGSYAAPPPGMPANNYGGGPGRNPNQPQGNAGMAGLANNSAGRTPSFGSAGTSSGNSTGPAVPANAINMNVDPTQEILSPEAQILMIEKQRQEMEARGDPAAAILPRTPLTGQMQN